MRYQFLGARDIPFAETEDSEVAKVIAGYLIEKHQDFVCCKPEAVK